MKHTPHFSTALLQRFFSSRSGFSRELRRRLFNFLYIHQRVILRRFIFQIHRSIRSIFPPRSRIAFSASLISSSAFSPLYATKVPPTLTRGRHHSTRTFMEATARDTHRSYRSRCSLLCPASSARRWNVVVF